MLDLYMQHLRAGLAARPVKFHWALEGDLSHYAAWSTPLGFHTWRAKTWNVSDQQMQFMMA